MNAMNSDASQLVEAARQGSRPAAGRLVEEYYQRVFAFLRRLSGNDADAADLTQRTFAKVWQALPGFEGRSTVSSWIHGIARHVYLDWRRADRRAEAQSDEWWTACASDGPQPDELVLRADMGAVVYAAVDRLEPDLRDTVHLHYYQELTLQETADALGIAASTVKYRLRLALEALQKALEQGTASVK